MPTHIKVEVESFLSLDQQTQRQGVTWLDALRANKTEPFPQQTTFGIKVEEALKKRENVLNERGLTAKERSYEALQTSEFDRFTSSLNGQEISLQNGQTTHGIISRYKLLGDGYYQVIKNSDGFMVRKVKPTESRRPIGQQVEITKGRSGLSIKEASRDRNRGKGQARGR